MKHFFTMTIEYSNSRERDQILEYLDKNVKRDYDYYEDYPDCQEESGFVEIRDISLSAAKVIEDELNLD